MSVSTRERPARPQGPGPSRRMLITLVLLPSIVARLAIDLRLANFEQLVAMAAGVLVLCVIARVPAPSLAFLIGLLPFQLVLISGLYEIGFTGGVARMAGLWKELVVVAVVAAAWRRNRGHPRPPDALDRVGMGFLALGTVYLLIPGLFVDSAGASLSFDTRFAGWRLLVFPTVLLLAGRRLRLDEEEIGRVLRAATRMAIALGVVAVVEFVASDWWNRLLIDTFGVNRFRVEVLDVDLVAQGLTIDDIRTYGTVAGREFVRVGGPMASYLTFSFVLLIAAGLLLEQVIRRASRPAVTVGLGCCVAGVLFTQTRSSIIGLCVLLLAVLRPAPGRSGASRVRYTLLAGAALVVALPLVFGSGLTDRFTSEDTGSDDVHDARVDAAVDTIGDEPLGLGLAMGSTASGRAVEGSVSVENQLLDTGVQLGVLGMVLFAAQYALLLRALHRAASGASPMAQLGALGVRNGMIGLLVPLWYQQAFGVVEVSWVLFALAGATLGAAEGSRRAAS
jgi:hypothetical protein